jgi:hypothetical protein
MNQNQMMNQNKQIMDNNNMMSQNNIPMMMNQQNNQLFNQNNNNNIIFNNQNPPLNQNNPQLSNPNNPMNGNGQSQNPQFLPPTKTKLIDLGDTSYLNSVLQLLGNIPEFQKYFLNQKNQTNITEKIKNHPLSFVVYRLFYHLHPENGKEELYKPDSLLEVLGILNVVYKSHKRRNPNDLIAFILNTLHKELNKVKNSENPNPNLNLINKEQAILAGSQNFKQFNRSTISGNLNWFEVKESMCKNCGLSLYNLYSFNTFELDILSTYKIKNNSITIYDCLNFYEYGKPQKLFCNRCHSYSQFINKKKVYCMPNMIIFSLNRGELTNDLINVPFMIEEQINLSQKIEASSPDNNYNYKLAGIVSVFKDDKGIFKYSTFCKSSLDQQWYYYFNDEKIIQYDFNKVLQLHNNSKYIPCILLYKQII